MTSNLVSHFETNAIFVLLLGFKNKTLKKKWEPMNDNDENRRLSLWKDSKISTRFSD